MTQNVHQADDKVQQDRSCTHNHLSSSSNFLYFQLIIAQRAFIFSLTALSLALITAVRISALLIGAGIGLLILSTRRSTKDRSTMSYLRKSQHMTCPRILAYTSYTSIMTQHRLFEGLTEVMRESIKSVKFYPQQLPFRKKTSFGWDF